MASKKDFRGKKPETAVEANAVAAFLDNAPQTAETSSFKAEEEAVTIPAGSEKATYKPTPKRKPDLVIDQRRNKAIHFLTTVTLYEYLKQVAWENKQSVNDYINMLIEADKAEREGK